ncbi:MAG TPA: rhodanese-like domain-containing protein, partial [Candidatus Limnocylindria bacterium]|nr:rhodanese-like domain-containing protein [Candidatus Limnocylindria bacterium]
MTDQPISPRHVTATEALRLAAEGYRIIDVREQVEWDAGHIPGATLLPLADVASRYAEVLPEPNAPLLLHCAVGAR